MIKKDQSDDRKHGVDGVRQVFDHLEACVSNTTQQAL